MRVSESVKVGEFESDTIVSSDPVGTGPCSAEPKDIIGSIDDTPLPPKRTRRMPASSFPLFVVLTQPLASLRRKVVPYGVRSRRYRWPA